ncbi:MAG: M23 family metallopeptidase [Clostridium sp.]|nr:MAG: M23 family metallopeptidase [Clostridium sp.]
MYLTAKVLKASVYSNDNLSYVYRNLIDDTVPVVSTDDGKVIKPFGGEEVSVVKGFYEKDAESKAQEQSIIYYQNTYMPNTGVLYGAKEEFEVLVVADGTVEDVVADEVLGNVVTIKHTNNLITRYESLNEVNVMVGDTFKKRAMLLGLVVKNKIDSTYSNMLFI